MDVEASAVGPLGTGATAAAWTASTILLNDTMTTTTTITARDFLATMLPTPQAHERIQVKGKSDTGQITQKWAGTIDEALTLARPLVEDHDVWVGVGLYDDEDGHAEHVTRYRVVWADLDGKCYTDGKAGAAAALTAFPLPPSVVVDSGHGFHPYWCLSEPHDQEDADRAQGVMRGIAQVLAATAQQPLDAVHDLTRVLRLPETFNRKSAPPVPVRVVTFEPERTYHLSDFIDLGIWDDAPSPAAPVATWDAVPAEDGEAALHRALAARLPRWVIGALEQPEAYTKKSESELDFGVVRELLRRGLTFGEVEAVWLTSNLGARDKVQRRGDYRARTINRAQASLATSDGGQPDLQSKNPMVGGQVQGLVEFSGEELAQAGDSAGPLSSLPLLGQEGYIIEGWSHLISGYPRCGKTELLARLVRAWVSAGITVLYITEEPATIWQQRLARLGDSWHSLRVVLALGADPARLLERAVSGHETVIVVDTIRNLLQLSDETDNSKVALALNPWIAACRNAGKTLLALHHDRKGGGEHGEGIAGGHALLGVFDIALEVVRTKEHNRRLIKPYARLVSPHELLYEMGVDGVMVALGDPKALTLADVKARVRDVLTEEWQRTSDIYNALGEPQPSQEQVRLALVALAHEGKAERNPPISEDAKGKTHRWRSAPDAGSDHYLQ